MNAYVPTKLLVSTEVICVYKLFRSSARDSELTFDLGCLTFVKLYSVRFFPHIWIR
jgi:hypothetical protein